VRLPDDRIDTARLAETEDNPVLDVRWWPLSDLEETRDRVEPQGLAGLARRIVSGERMEKPAALRWSAAASGGS
jgi:hypothetical protein